MICESKPVRDECKSQDNECTVHSRNSDTPQPNL